MAGLRARSLLAGAFAALLAACSQAPKVVPLQEIAFPVVLVTGASPVTRAMPHRARVFANLDQLSHMRVELYSVISSKDPAEAPKVIDANAQVLDMMNIEGEHGSLWMMANPSGMMPIRFTLIRRKETGIEAARTMIAQSEFLGHDIDAERRQLRSERILRAASMAEIMQIVDEMPDTDAAAAKLK